MIYSDNQWLEQGGKYLVLKYIIFNGLILLFGQQRIRIKFF